MKRRVIQQILGYAAQIANDVVAFDDHLVVIQDPKAKNSESVWQFPSGFVNSSAELGVFSKVRSQIDNTTSCGCFATTLDDTALCVVGFSAPSGSRGTLAVSRPTVDPFTNQEKLQLQAIAQLLSSAFRNGKGRSILHSLYLAFISRRTYLANADVDNLLADYARKAQQIGSVAFDEDREHTEASVRASIKLVTANRTALRIAACETSDLGQSAPVGDRIRFVLHENDSIAAQVFNTNCPFRTNAYWRDEQSEHSLFPDIASHVSVPIAAGKGECLGVLSIETPSPKAYDENTTAALTLLGAHCALRLQAAMFREESKTKENEKQVVDAALNDLQRCLSWSSIVERLQKTFQKLQYSRGLICEVDHSKRSLQGRFFWGDGMREVARCMTRRFEQDQDDCQVIVAQEQRPVVIHDPRTDSRVSSLDSALQVDIRPFAILPLIDTHGLVRWTVHVERADHAPIGDHDIALIQLLSNAAMRSWQDVRNGQIEREWAQRMLQTTDASLERLLELFADFIVANDVVTRCRVYDVSQDGLQTGAYQSGRDKVRDFIGLCTKRGAARTFETLTGHRKPVLVVASERELVPNDEGWVIEHVDRMPHEFRLVRNAVSEWVEAPILRSGFMVAKIVVDHHGRTNDRFQREEIRLLASLSNLLSLSAENAALNDIRSQLSLIGLNNSVLRHHMFNCLDHIRYSASGEGGDELRKRITEVSKAIRRLDSIYTGHDKEANTTIADEIVIARELLKPNLGSVRLFVDDTNLRADSVTIQGHPLSLILLQLLNNAINAIVAAAEQDDSEDDPIITIRVREGTHNGDSRTVEVLVEDNGVGVSDEVAMRLSRTPEVVQRTKGLGTGLAYANLLARRFGWKLSLHSRRHPTVFRIEINHEKASHTEKAERTKMETTSHDSKIERDAAEGKLRSP